MENRILTPTGLSSISDRYSRLSQKQSPSISPHRGLSTTRSRTNYQDPRHVTRKVGERSSEPTDPMRTEAASAGFYETPGQEGKHYARIQLLTIAELLDGRRFDYPQFSHEMTFKPAPIAKGKKKHTHKPLEFGKD